MNENCDNTKEIIPNIDATGGDTDDNSNSKKKELTRSYIAQLYVWAFFVVIIAVFIVGCFNSFKVQDYKDLLVTVRIPAQCRPGSPVILGHLC